MAAADGTAAARAKRDRNILIAAWVLAFAPGVWLTFESFRVATSAYTAIPFWDHWAMVADYMRAQRDGLSWDILFAQSNEHRTLIGRLIMFADLAWLGGRNILPQAGTIASQVALLALFATIALRLKQNRAAAFATLGLVTALLFSLGQWENLVWAFQVQFLLVAAAGVWSGYLFCMAFAEREKIGYGAWAGSLALLFVSAFSMANGMVAGAACVGVGLLARLRWQGLVGQAAAVAAIAALYFHGYVSASPDGVGVAGALSRPGEFLAFVATYLGNPARAYGLGPPLWLGALGLALSVAAALRVLLGRDRDAGRLTLVIIMAFVVASAVITAMGRLSFGVAQGLVSRYLTFGLIFWAAHALYWGSQVRLRRPLALLAWAALLAALTYPLAVLHVRSEPDVAARRDGLRLGVMALRAGADDPEALGAINFSVPAILPAVAFLRSHQLSVFADTRSDPVGAMLDPAVAVRPNGCLASFDVIAPVPAGTAWRASGWAWDVRAGRAVEQVLLVDATGRIVAFGSGGGYRPDILPVVRLVRSDRTGWMASLARAPAFPVAAYGVLRDGKRCDIGRHERPPG